MAVPKAPAQLVSFFYLLGRDSLPLGEITRVAKEADGINAPIFTNYGLEMYARELAARFMQYVEPLKSDCPCQLNAER